jgi:ATP-dependent Clp protease ATP-binding subunit ClpB
MQFNRLAKRLEAMDIQIDITENAVDELARLGYNPQFGARPVKRAIQQLVLNDLSRKILADQVDRTKPIIIDEFGDGLVFRN